MLSRLYGVLLPFFVSFLLAYLLDPVVNFVQNKCRVKNRILSVSIFLAHMRKKQYLCTLF